jgi:hypothetical protein
LDELGGCAVKVKVNVKRGLKSEEEEKGSTSQPTPDVNGSMLWRSRETCDGFSRDSGQHQDAPFLFGT